MCQDNKIQLKPTCIINVPVKIYGNDFTFIVNGKKYKTNQLISDLLSPKISRIHSIDPTFDQITINTKYKGEFEKILNLVTFNQHEISVTEIGFFCEVIEFLGNENFEIFKGDEFEDIDEDNVFTLLNQHEKYPEFYSSELTEEIDYISSHVYDFFDTQEDELIDLSANTLYDIIDNRNLQLKDEDQLLNFINKVYSKEQSYSILYEKVFFLNVSEMMMNKFFEIFDINDITCETWNQIVNRMKAKNQKKDRKTRYFRMKEKEISISKQDDKEFNGIINFLKEKYGSQLEDEISITDSSFFNNSDCYQPANLILFEDREKYFWSNNLQNSWICFDFKERKIRPTDYTIRSINCDANYSHPRSWVIEGSNDKTVWTILDEEVNCSRLNGKSKIHSFNIQKQISVEFRFIRMRQIGTNWRGNHFLALESFELFGVLN